MNKQTITIAALSFCILLSTDTQANSNANAGVPTISVTNFDLSYGSLRLSFEIINNSNQDIWICDSIAQGHDFEAFLDEDGQTIVIRKRMDVPTSIMWLVRPTGKYVRLGPGKKRTESLLLGVPINPIHVYTSRKYSQRVTKSVCEKCRFI